MDREFDIVVFGATGFMGGLIAHYLESQAPAGLKVGLVARSVERLRTLRNTLAGVGASWDLIEADAHSRDSMDALARRTKVVITTVGPYLKYGNELVGACARAGTHYVDLTGESLFVRHAAQEFHAVAQQSHARIVHSCGFDSVPSDILVLLLAQRAHADGEGDLEDTFFRIVSLKGGVSGGTVDSMRVLVEQVSSDPELARAFADPYTLSPDREHEPTGLGEERDTTMPFRTADGKWVLPFVMGPHNTRIVRRSNALTNWSYGRKFKYTEVVLLGDSLLAPVVGAATAFGFSAVAVGMAFGVTRWMLDKALPAPGEGPSIEKMLAGHLHAETVTRTSSGARYRATIHVKGDPGYLRTATMISESALALALDEKSLPNNYGVLTPATAIGACLAERLRKQDFSIEVERL